MQSHQKMDTLVRESLANRIEAEILPQTQNTPVREVEIAPGKVVFIKLEGTNETGSIKVRPAANMLYHAAKDGLLHPEIIVVESTSGNTGIGVAWVCQQLGIEYHNFSPDTLSQQKREKLTEYGARLMFSSGGTDEATAHLKRVLADHPDRYYWPSQFTNNNNWRAHLEQTVPELLKQVPHVQHVFCGFGSGGTATGTAHALKDTGIKLSVVQNTEERAKRVEGMRNLAWISKPDIADMDVIGWENMYSADPDTILPIAKYIYENNDQLLVGPTTAAILTHTVLSKDAHIAVISPDNGERYPKWVDQVTE